MIKKIPGPEMRFGGKSRNPSRVNKAFWRGLPYCNLEYISFAVTHIII
jgi:hypothetical protein